MYKSILLPIDLNHDASWQKALPAALDQMGADSTLHIFCVVPDFGMSMVASYFPKDFEAKALQHMKEELDAFRAQHVPTDARVEVHVGHGHVVEQILHAAEQTAAGLIVMASHPPDEIREFLVGSSADRVVRKSPISVLVVR